MKKLLLVLYLSFICLIFVACSQGRIYVNGASDSMPFSGYQAIDAPKEADVNEGVPIIFYYGHNNNDESYPDYVNKTVLIVYARYITIDNSTTGDHEDVILYSDDLNDFYSEENRCEIKSISITSQDIKFNSDLTVDIDFKNLGFPSGSIVFEIREFNDFTTSDTDYVYVRKSIQFYIDDDDKVHFGLDLQQLLEG